jgi:hypothetical protein
MPTPVAKFLPVQPFKPYIYTQPITLVQLISNADYHQRNLREIAQEANANGFHVSEEEVANILSTTYCIN